MPTPKPAPIVMATPHEQPDLSESTGDPISIEIGDQVFPLIARGVTDQGVWETGENATWLHGAVVRKVIVLPAVKAQKGIDSIILRLRNGTRLVYDELRWLEIGRTEIEFLLSDQPSIIVIMLDDNPSANTRKIILGTWRPLIEETEKATKPTRDLEPQKSDLKRNHKCTIVVRLQYFSAENRPFSEQNEPHQKESILAHKTVHKLSTNICVWITLSLADFRTLNSICTYHKQNITILSRPMVGGFYMLTVFVSWDRCIMKI